VTGAPPLACRGITKIYPTADGAVTALLDVDADFAAGRITIVAGPSGSGKSSLLRILAGLDRPTGGKVCIGDTDLTTAGPRDLRRVQRHDVAYVFQEPSRNLFSYVDAGGHLRLWRDLRGLARRPSAPMLSAVGLGDREKLMPVQLSGGEQQRLAFAAAVGAETRVVLADEPTSQLDAVSSSELIEVILRLRDTGATMVIASHDPDVLEIADDVVLLDHGVAHVGGSASRAARIAPRGAPTPPSSPPALLAAEGLTRHFGSIAPVIDATLTLSPGELVAIIGASGSGKTTLVNLLCGWERPDTGTIRWDGAVVEPSTLGWSELALIPQSVGLLTELTAAENIALPCRVAHVVNQDLADLLGDLDLGVLADRLPNGLSLGECQRVGVARALVLAPRLILADEPTSHQDSRRTGMIVELLRRHTADGAACLVATHDDDLVAAADRVLVMRDGHPQPT